MPSLDQFSRQQQDRAEEIVGNLELLAKIGQLLELDDNENVQCDMYLPKLRKLFRLKHSYQHRVNKIQMLLPTIQQNYIDMSSLWQLFVTNHQRIVTSQHEKIDDLDSENLTCEVELKYVTEKLAAFDLQSIPSITHSDLVDFQKHIENLKCECDLLQEHVAYWMPCQYPTIESLTEKLDQVKTELTTVEDEIRLIVSDGFDLDKSV
ncbi:unnamed protein product [Didymodactylos carnosus]|uniref:Uncharacterized protein n=1 Tax=Didymodactylos carnosus TaxID=1234261 RepID=A0A8S2GDD3_9BILA|nr:unnamed protein product [Didymodactylos carnosus]CAF3497275.1 unnamed protein product [Didymodactylos carnosus]